MAESNYIFGANGVVESEMDDIRLFHEYRPLEFEIAISSLVGFTLALSASFAIVWLVPDETETLFFQLVTLTVALISLIAGFVAFGKRAIEQGGLPGMKTRHYLDRFEEASEPVDPDLLPHRHITGFGAFVLLLFLSFVSIAGTFGHIFHDKLEIPQSFGIAIIILVCMGLASLIFAPKFTDLSFFNAAYGAARTATAFLNPLGRVLSRIDSWLVYIVAPTVGATQSSTIRRYSILFGHLGTSLFFAWFGPPIVALACVSWAIIAAISVARRWSWVEADRDAVLRNGKASTALIRVGTKQDLRDEALFGLLFLILLLPFGMRQIHLFLDQSVFEVPVDVLNDPQAWLGFFGVELTKALPFIDWSDIYGAQGNTRIKIDSAMSMHSVFGARVLIDLVFLASILQAISISVSLAKHKKQFLAKAVNKLDPRIEKNELAKLAIATEKKGTWKFREELDQYLHYDDQQLSFVRMKTRKSRTARDVKVYAVVKEIFKRSQRTFTSPNELLKQTVKEQNPDSLLLMDLLSKIQKMDIIDLDVLIEVRENLNWRGNLQNVRSKIVELMIHAVDISAARANALANVISGTNYDSLAPIRELVLDHFARNEREAKLAMNDIRQVALSDQARSLQKKAREILRKYNLNFYEASPAPPLTSATSHLP